MSVYFVDTSALAKRYVRETGSTWLSELLAVASGNASYVASIAAVEVVSAVSRRRRAGHLSDADADAVLQRFRADFETEYRVLEITPTLILEAMALAEKRALRAYDAVQLAAARLVQAECKSLELPFTFISSDGELNAAARDEGLAVDDPNMHV